jgi:hypothetical protein
MEMKLDETIERYKNNAEYERTHGNLQGCLEFRQLAEWLEQLQRIEFILNWREYDVDPNYHTNEDMIDDIRKVIEE